MLAHLTFDDQTYGLKMNVRMLAPDVLIDVDPERYRDELALKDTILASNSRYYSQALPNTQAMQWETVALLLPNMARHYPDFFALDIDGDRWRWTNRLLDTETAFTLGDPATLPLPPLDWVGRQVQEDLCLMDGNAPGGPLVAGHLCFASGWSLNEKMGRSFLAIHDPVPDFAERIGRSADLMMQRLKPGRPTARVNWTIAVTDRLNLAPMCAHEWAHLRRGITAENAGARCYLRSEWQTLSRLPRTNAVLFTIRTRVAPIAEAITDPDDARRLASLLRTMPEAMRAYKSASMYIEALMTYLEMHAASLENLVTGIAR